MPDQVVVTIAYEGVDGEEYVDEFPLDTNLIRQRTYVTSSRAPESQTKEMVKVLRTTIVGRDLAPEVMDRFYARSEGNAFYAEELIAAASSGAARRTSGTGKGCPPPGTPASTTRSPSSNGFAVLPDMLVRASAAVALSLRLCALVNPDDSAAERGPGPRYVLDDH